jgi:hypothetical protein
VVAVVAVVVVSVPSHFEIPRKKIQKRFEKTTNFETSRGLSMCCKYI